MVQFRTFRNTDPPRLVEVWNETFTGRGAVVFPNSTLLERFVFSKPIFDPAGLIVAEDAGVCVGFAHAAMSQAASAASGGAQAADDPIGVTCLIGVRPARQRQGIGTELLHRCEDYLRVRGARTLRAGPHWPHNPFYLGLYGGCDSPGFLTSDAKAEPFFQRHGYKIVRKVLVMQRLLDHTVKIIDPRFAPHRQRFLVRGCSPRSFHGYWNECILGFIEPVELVLEEKQTGEAVARVLMWEMEGFGSKWHRPTIGIMGFEVQPKWQRLGVGKYLLSQLLREVQEQFFELAEVHLHEHNQPAIQFLKSLAFQHVDTGQVYERAPLAG
ncbi:MAG: GNAT family N-acetyltransferase [Planctomycetes bacterium]|nr:GNAT family N-acetyltransferase [Planctomycetota bacterium]